MTSGAARRNDGRLQLWAVTNLGGVLTGLVQLSPDGDWGAWSDRADRDGRGEARHP